MSGLLLSLFILITGGANMLMMATLWVLYHSINSVGQRWYVYYNSKSVLVCTLYSVSQSYSARA